jgi:hypothetical protein
VSEIGSPPRLTGVPGHVDVEVADRERLGPLVVAAAQPGPHPGDELLGLERLDDVVVGAGLEADDDVDGVGLGGEHDDRDAGLGRICRHTSMPSRPGSIRSSRTRSGGLSRKAAEGLVAVGAEHRLEALAAQHDPEHLGQRGVVVDDEHPSHRPMGPGARRTPRRPG